MKLLTAKLIAEKYILGIGNDALNDKHAIECMKEDINNLVNSPTLKDLVYEVADYIKKDPNHGGEVIVFSNPIIKECEHPKDKVTTLTMYGSIYRYCTNCNNDI